MSPPCPSQRGNHKNKPLVPTCLTRTGALVMSCKDIIPICHLDNHSEMDCKIASQTVFSFFTKYGIAFSHASCMVARRNHCLICNPEQSSLPPVQHACMWRNMCKVTLPNIFFRIITMKMRYAYSCSGLL